MLGKKIAKIFSVFLGALILNQDICQIFGELGRDTKGKKVDD